MDANTLNSYNKKNYYHVMPFYYLSKGAITKIHRSGGKTVCCKCGESINMYSWGTHIREAHYNDSIFFVLDEEKIDKKSYQYELNLNKKLLHTAEMWHLEFIKEMYGHRKDFKFLAWERTYQNAISLQVYYDKKMNDADIIYNSEHSTSYFEKLKQQLLS